MSGSIPVGWMEGDKKQIIKGGYVVVSKYVVETNVISLVIYQRKWVNRDENEIVYTQLN